MVLPLVKKGDWVEFRSAGKKYTMKCFNANPSTVWVEDDKGKILKLHKLRNFIKLTKEPKKKKDNKKLFENLKKSIK